MNVPAHIASYLDSKVPMFQIVDEVLDAWTGDGCLQFPTLMGAVIPKMGWLGKEGEKLARANEPIIRDYVRNHENWHVTRGAHGGIMRKADQQKKIDAKLAKEKAKADLALALDAEIARKKAEALAKQAAVLAPTAAPPAAVADNTESEE